MFWRRVSICLLCLLTLAIPFEHKYDKLFRFFSLKLIPPDVVLPNFFEKKIYFYPSDVIAVALFLIACFAIRLPMRRFFISKGAGFLWIVFLFTFISILYSPLSHYPIPYLRLFQLATPFILFCFLANGLRDVEKPKILSLLFGCIIAAAAIQSVVAIAQYAIQGPLGLRLLGESGCFSCFSIPTGHRWLFDIHKIPQLIPALRSPGTFPHPNVLGGFLSLSILATYSFFSIPRLRCLFPLLLPLQFFAMTLTFSRSALFSWLIGTLVWFGLQWKENGLHKAIGNPGIKILLLSIFAAVAFSAIVLHEPIIHRGGIVNYNELAQGSDATRIRYQNIALEIIKDHPLHGAGFQQLSIRAIDYTSKDAQDELASGTHNIYLYLAAETGLFSLAAFILFIFSLLWAAMKSPYTPALASLIAMFIALLFIGGCDFYPLLFQQGKLLFFVAAGLLAANVSASTALIRQEAS